MFLLHPDESLDVLLAWIRSAGAGTTVGDKGSVFRHSTGIWIPAINERDCPQKERMID
jgi:hypothetical protein